MRTLGTSSAQYVSGKDFGLMRYSLLPSISPKQFVGDDFGNRVSSFGSNGRSHLECNDSTFERY